MQKFKGLIARAALFAIFLIFVSHTFAGNGNRGFYEISGIVRDSGTDVPIAFATISVEGTTIGTVTNVDGEFTLKIPANLDVSYFGISHIGYRNSFFGIGEYAGREMEIFIDPQSVLIPEVIIKPTDARSIVASALNRVEGNYPESPFRLTGFYRETVRQRRDYISISEAVVDIYQAPYNTGGDADRFRIIQGRKSGDVKKADTLIVKLQGGPHVTMLLDIVKNQELLISAENLNFYFFDLLDVVQIDEVSNYVIGFRPRVVLSYPLYYGKLYISVDRHAITMAEFSLDLSDKEKAGRSFILRKPARLRFDPVSSSYMVTYREMDGRYHVNYIRYEVEFFADWRRRLFRTGYTIMSEMAITHRTSENVVRFSARESLRPDIILADQVPVYFEEDYWGEYNYIEPDRSIYSAIMKLNRRLVR